MNYQDVLKYLKNDYLGNYLYNLFIEKNMHLHLKIDEFCILLSETKKRCEYFVLTEYGNINCENVIHYRKPRIDFNICVNNINEIIGRKPFYIGVTQTPVNRFNDHFRQKKLQNMHLICVCQGKKQTMALEKRLIKKFKKRKFIINQNGGGGGIKDGLNFIYVMT